ncbi:hypothetical protein GCM10010252_19380 [Streptomyces aureoverticillatus]|nr:hypothetical protein GCM10010252_19380 [Streptomyces aureoverticillatus]
MAFPDDPLRVRVELQLGEQWLDITGDVYTESPITITRGRPDEGARTDAGSCVFVLDNTTGRYSPRNPRSDLYGKIGRNTPVRISVQPNPSGPRLVRFVGEIAAWPVTWGTPHTVRVSVTAAGILRRLGQGAKPFDSTLRRAIPTHEPLAYWPMEDGASATQAASPIEGVGPLLLSGARWAQADSLPSSAPLPTIASAGSVLPMMHGPVPAPTAPLDGWNVQWLYRLDAIPAELRTFMCIRTTGTVATWYFQSAHLSSRIIGRDAHGRDVFVQNVGTGNDLFNQWVRVRFLVRQNGPNVEWRLDWIDVGGDAGGYGSTYPGKIGRPTGVASPPDGYSPLLDGMALGHISVWPAESTPAYGGAIDAWAGETVGNRMQRLAREEAVPLAYTGRLTALGTRVGPQAAATLLDLLQECADADGGILYEQRDALSLAYRTRAMHYTQAPALTLDYAAREVVAPLEPVDDDQAVRNDITIARTGGSSARAVLETGTLSVSPPPAGIGRYTEQRTLNLHTDDQCAPTAWWALHRGTWDEARYPSVSVALHEAPHLVEQVAAVDVGARAQILNPPRWLPPERVELLVEGYTEVLGVRTWDVEFSCSPGGPWLVATLDDAEYATAASDGTELAAPVTAEATTFAVRVVAGPPWPTPEQSGEAFPLDVRIGGEHLVVHAVTAPAAGRQTFTVTRGANGLSLPHPAGAAVSLVRPALVAL